MRILLADNDVVTREEISKMLKSFGYDVTMVDDGIELLEHINPVGVENLEKPELVITEILMPNLDGYSAAKIARTQFESDVPIVAITHIPQNDVVEISEPFVSVIRKPVNEHELLKVILTLTCPNCFSTILALDHKQHQHFDCKRCRKRYLLQQQNGELVVTEKS